MTEELQSKIETKRAGRLATTPESLQGVFKRAWSGKSRGAGVKAFCLECIGFDKAAISTCTAFACPLWPYRPYRVRAGAATPIPDSANALDDHKPDEDTAETFLGAKHANGEAAA